MLLTSSLDINNLGKWNNGMKIITIWSTSKASSFLNKIIKPLLHIFTLPYCLKRTNSIFCTYYYVQIMYNWRNLQLSFHRHFNACNNRLFYAIRKKLLICLNFLSSDNDLHLLFHEVFIYKWQVLWVPSWLLDLILLPPLPRLWLYYFEVYFKI